MVKIRWDASDDPDTTEHARSFEQADQLIRQHYPTAYYVQDDINGRVTRTYWPSKAAEEIGDAEDVVCFVEP